MGKDKIYRYWLYFNSLCSDLEYTTRYVDHQNGDVENTKKCSIEFLRLLLSIGSEFEIICKLLCKQFNNEFDIGNQGNNITVLSEKILSKYPKIIQNRIYTDYESMLPLKDWKIEDIDGKKRRKGLNWWDSYNKVKHNRNDYFYKANLSEVINSLGSLLIIELYLQMEVLGEIKFYNCSYFSCEYFPQSLVTESPILPDFKK